MTQYFLTNHKEKTPRGILYYDFNGSSNTSISWKLTGNLGGEDYVDKVRGAYNEGGLFAERQGFHLPGAPTADWKVSSPYDGVDKAGVAFYKFVAVSSIPFAVSNDPQDFFQTFNACRLRYPSWI